MKKSRFSVKFSTQIGGGKLLLISLLTSFSMFAQNQQNTLPTTGNVGVGTTSPDVKLQVNGRMQVDSSLVVMDSAVFEKRAHIKDRIVVDEDAIIKGKLVARDKLKVKGTAKFEGKVKMLNLNAANNNDTTLLFVNPNGKVKKAGISVITNLMYGQQSPPCFQGYSPIWHNDPGVLWTGGSGLGCATHVGINTETPTHALEVNGQSYLNGITKVNGEFSALNRVAIGDDPLPFSTLNIKTLPSAPGMQVNIGVNLRYETANANEDSYAMRVVVNNDDIKAIGVVNATNNADVFRVYGDGKIWATGINIKNYTLFPDYVFDKDYHLMSFSDLRKFIKQYHRLPKMPSAKEVQANGLELDQVVVKQQEKIEELTLYILQLEKRLSKLEKASQ